MRINILLTFVVNVKLFNTVGTTVTNYVTLPGTYGDHFSVGIGGRSSSCDRLDFAGQWTGGVKGEA